MAGFLPALLLGCAAQGTSEHSANSPEQKTIAISADAAAQAADKPGTALVETFSQFCLNRFPDAANLAEGGLPTGTSLIPLSPEQLRHFLHADPGRGWELRSPEGDYTITVENPPYHACAVRRSYPTLPGYRLRYQLSLNAWAVSGGRGRFEKEVVLPSPAGAVSSKNMVMPLPPARGRPLELFIDIETPLPNGWVEVRLVRQIPDPSVQH